MPGSFAGGLGVNVNFDAGHRRDVERIAAFGFRVVRADLLWAKVETRRGDYDWRGPDELVRHLRDNKLIPLLILAYSNPLYSPRVIGHPMTDSMAYAAPEHGKARTAFMRFVRTAARRYGSDVIWEIWNEPDHNFGDPVDLRAYISFAQQACQQIRSVVSDATVIGPAAASFGWRFLRAFVQADRHHCFNALSVHPYRDAAPESVLQDWAHARALLPRCTEAQRCTGLADSEWGYSATGGAWTAKRQAEYVVRLRLLDVMADIPLTIIYDWQNDGPDPTDTEANFGLIGFHGDTKPVYTALADMIRDLRGLYYMGRVATSRSSDFLLAFGAGGTLRKLVGWSGTDRVSTVALSGRTCVAGEHVAAALPQTESCGGDGFVLSIDGKLRLSATPVVVAVTQRDGGRVGNETAQRQQDVYRLANPNQ